MTNKIEEKHEHKNGCCEHHHDHEHHHEHHHNHHHGGSKVMMGSADGHIVGTMTAYTPASLPVAELNMKLCMNDIVDFLNKNGSVPLQVKASLKDTVSTVLLNMVGTEIFHSENTESTETDVTKVKCKLLVTADNVEPQLLKDELENYMNYFIDNSF